MELLRTNYPMNFFCVSVVLNCIGVTNSKRFAKTKVQLEEIGVCFI